LFENLIEAEAMAKVLSSRVGLKAMEEDFTGRQAEDELRLRSSIRSIVW
jgi:hypothetical protein